MKPKAFVLMPFLSDLESVYKFLITESLEKAGFEVIRADDIRSQNNILKDVVNAIQTCDLLVADLTGSNPNVYYELGIAHALNRPVILLTQDISELPFDLRSYRVIPYSTHFTQVEKAKKELLETGLGALNKTIMFGNPVSDFGVAATSIAKEQAQSNENTQEPADDRGYLDHVVEFIDGMSELSRIIANINEGTKQIGEQVSSTSTRISASSPLSIAEKRKAVQLLAAQQLTYGKLIEGSNDSFRQQLRNIESNIEYIFGGSIPVQDDAKNSLVRFIGASETTVEQAEKGKNSFIQLSEVMNALPNIEKNFDRAKKYVVTQLCAFGSSIDQMISVLGRARELAKRLTSPVATGAK